MAYRVISSRGGAMGYLRTSDLFSSGGVVVFTRSYFLVFLDRHGRKIIRGSLALSSNTATISLVIPRLNQRAANA